MSVEALVEVTFEGIAPIPSGTEVEMDVDDVNHPKEAFSIFDTARNTTYHFRPSPEPETARAFGIDPGGPIRARVDSAQVFQKSTILTISNVRLVH